MHRFFVPPAQIGADSAHVLGDDARQMFKVLRLRPGETVTLLDGTGKSYLVRIGDITEKRVEGPIISMGEAGTEPMARVAIVQGLPKGDKLEHIIQKATELGVSAIYPVSTVRGVVQLDDKRAGDRLLRWRRVAKEAAEQSGRGIIPHVGELMTWKARIKDLADNGWVIAVLWENASGVGLISFLRDQWFDSGSQKAPIALCVGPEGGLEKSEVEYSQELGAHTVTLGPRILRTETAGPIAVASVMIASGDLP